MPYSTFTILKKYLHYWITAANGKGHGIHSPFVYDFVEKVLNTKPDTATEAIEILRNNLQKDSTVLQIEDFGAGSVSKASTKRTVAAIAKLAAKPKKYALLLHNIIKHYNSKSIIELGTSLGISTAYMAMANKLATISTCEGSNEIAQKAETNFQQLGLANIHIYKGEFEKSYLTALMHNPTIDLLFIDGNHQYKPTIQYFDKAVPYLNNDSIILFDDIHWSTEMEKAWASVKQHELVSESIDLFFVGILFFRKEQKVKQHFTIRY